jgi:hypothetical protein
LEELAVKDGEIWVWDAKGGAAKIHHQERDAVQWRDPRHRHRADAELTNEPR